MLLMFLFPDFYTRLALRAFSSVGMGNLAVQLLTGEVLRHAGSKHYITCYIIFITLPRYDDTASAVNCDDGSDEKECGKSV